ncbi:MAG: phosphoenolpyruvate--protein phosphotransferase [Spirochaetes bacterium]|nr:phosphoenolpyruvate--protein phosphotransferase [Spirochaetota bacterium]
MEIYHGLAAASGIVIGKALIYNQEVLIPKFSISEYQVELEIDRFYTALRKTKKEYLVLQKKLIEEMSEDEAKFLDAHILMTEDQMLIGEVVNNLREKKKNLEWIIYQVVDEIYKKFTQMKEIYFQERAVDILDLGRKLIQILLTQKNNSLADIEEDVIIIASDLSVSDTASMNKKHILGFVTELGGQTSHVSILARSLAIPAVVGIKDISHKINTGDLIILDAINGELIIDPDEDLLEKYQLIKEKYEEKEQEYLTIKGLPAVTLDEKELKLRANMEIPEQEIDSVIHYGASGVGLYRSEFLYLSKKRKVLPTETQQFNAYKFILEQLNSDEVTIRTLDLGGDKVLDGITNRELNPNLGWRAIRFCLANKQIFKTQLRALYRASIYGKLKIMFPMVSTVEEVIEAKEIIEEVKDDLRKEKIKFVEDIPLGIMVETPSCALTSGELAKVCDFFSIGTNDLIQYTLACDRGNQKIAYLYEPLHPSVLKLIQLTIENAHTNGITVSVCGEMGSDIGCALVLMGLGIDELSMTPIKILELKKVIRSIHYKEAQELAKKVIKNGTAEENRSMVKHWIDNHLNI